MTEKGEQQRHGVSVAMVACAMAMPVDRVSRSSARALGSLCRQAFVRWFDAGYDPKETGATDERHQGTPIAIRDLSVRYGRPFALENLSGTFAAGSLTAVVGPNGAGKSTLLKALAGIVRTRRGAIEGIGHRRRLAYLPQQSALDRGFPVTLGELVGLGGWRHFGAFRRAPSEISQRAAQSIATVGLDGFNERPIANLSVGQLQRAFFARLLMQDADVLLLDEPFAAIDERTSEDLLQLLRRWHEEGRTIIAVLHDLTQVRRHFPMTLLLARRSIAWGETASVLTTENLVRARVMLEGEAGTTRDVEA